MKEYNFPDSPESTDYKVFPECLEIDPCVFFHGTNASNLNAITTGGFIMPPVDRAQSVSFNFNSDLALGYASDSRTQESPEGSVIAVRYENPARPGLRRSGTILYDSTLDSQPEIIGWCIVPAGYRHI